MNNNFIFALVLILVAMGLGDRINDGVLTIAIGIASAFVLVGLFQTYGRKRPNPSDTPK